MLDLDQLLEVPNLPQLIERAQAALRAEAPRREQFYAQLREDQKAEFINGRIIMHSPVKERHWRTVGNIYRLLSTFAIKNGLGRVASEKALVSLTRNDYEPDVCFWKAEKADRFTAEQMQHPAPDLVIEVLSRGTARRDRGVKLEDYAAHGVGEYWIVNPGKQTIEQYVLDPEMEEYDPAKHHSAGDVLTSAEVAGFVVPVRAFFDEQANVAALTTLVNS